jgi:hypothetical protein
MVAVFVLRFTAEIVTQVGVRPSPVPVVWTA